MFEGRRRRPVGHIFVATSSATGKGVIPFQDFAPQYTVPNSPTEKGRRAGWINLCTSEDIGIGSLPIHERSVKMKNKNKILSFLRVDIVPVNFKDL